MDGNSTLCQCLIQDAHQPADSPPCDWIPAVHAGMTGFNHLCITMSAPAWETLCVVSDPRIPQSGMAGVPTLERGNDQIPFRYLLLLYLMRLVPHPIYSTSMHTLLLGSPRPSAPTAITRYNKTSPSVSGSRTLVEREVTAKAQGIPLSQGTLTRSTR